MNMKQDYYERREKAKKRVEELKQFYNHLRAYILINLLLLLLRTSFIDFIVDKTGELDSGFIYWIDVNIFLTPLLWGIGLSIHGIYAFRHKFTFFKKWEERQIQKFMEEEDQNSHRYQ